MRDYSKAGPRFWTGDTGKYLRRLGRDAQVIGFYLFTSPNANMIGLYYLPLATLVHETGVEITAARSVLAQIAEGPSEGLQSPFEGVYARYDEVSETVFVTEMARHQIGERLTRKDNRHKAVVRELEQYRKSPFFNDFLNRYRDDFELQDVAPSKPLRSPSGAPSKPGAGAGAEERAGTRTEHTQSAREKNGVETEGKGSGEGPPDTSCDTVRYQPIAYDEVERFKGGYPKGIYRQVEWITGERLLNHHVASGVPLDRITAGRDRYHAQCKARGSLGTQYVLSPVKFLDRDQPLFDEPFPLPDAPGEASDPEITWRPPPDDEEQSRANG